MEFLQLGVPTTILVIGWGGILYTALVSSRMAQKELELNDRTADHPLIQPHQVRWHIAHTRADVSGCVLLLAIIAAAVVWMAAILTAKLGLPWG